MSDITTINQADLTGLVDLLKTQRVRRVDLVADASKLAFDQGQLKIDSSEVVMSEDGVTPVGGWYKPNSVFDEKFSEAFKIPTAYLRMLREQGRTELIDQTGNHFLRGSSDGVNPADARKFMVRLFTGDDTGGGVARAFLSDRFRTIDNLDVLVTVLGGMQEAGLGPDTIGRCDLTERKMYVQVTCPEVSVVARELLKGYRSPFSGLTGDEVPEVFAGFVISNSEVGTAAASITPRAVFKVCNNGMTINRDAMRAIHVGQRKEEGLIAYAQDTMEAELQLILKKSRDAVKTFLTPEYLQRLVDDLTAKAGVAVTKPEATIKAVMQATLIPMTLQEDILGAFIKGGQMTSGGIMQAVTAVAQTVKSADRAYELEGLAVNVLTHAARLARVA